MELPKGNKGWERDSAEIGHEGLGRGRVEVGDFVGVGMHGRSNCVDILSVRRCGETPGLQENLGHATNLMPSAPFSSTPMCVFLRVSQNPIPSV